MKQVIAKEQVTANLERLFPARNGRCALIFDGIFLIDFPGTVMVAIENKQVFVRWPYAQHVQKLAAYKQDCENWNLAFVKKHFKGIEFIPFIWSKKHADEEAIKQQDQLLEAVGIGKKQKPDTDLTRLQKLAGKDYVSFYKLIQEVQVQGAFTECRKTPHLGIDYDALVIVHSTGRFSFPISDVVANNEAANQEIKHIFFNLLELPIGNYQQKAA